MFNSILPQNIDWIEINSFFDNNSFRGEIMSPKWREHNVFQTTPISDKSMKVLECLHEDLCQCFHTIFARYENGNEDRFEEHRLLEEFLFTKYGNISERVLKRIYSDYCILDR